MKIDLDLINRDFTYHRPKSDRVKDNCEEIRGILADAMIKILDVMPECREESLVKTKLEEAMMWAIAGIMRNQDG